MLAGLFTFRGPLNGLGLGRSLLGLLVFGALGFYAVTMVANMPIVLGGVSPRAVHPYRILACAALILLVCWSLTALVSRRLRDIGLNSVAAGVAIPVWVILASGACLFSLDVATALISAPFGVLTFMPSRPVRPSLAETFA